MAVRRGVWLVLVVIAVAVFISAAGVIALSFIYLPRGAAVPSQTTLVLKLQGDLAETEGVSVLDTFLPGRPTVRAVVDMLRAAKRDARVRQLLVVPTGQSQFWAKSQEIRDAIVDFRESGKKTAAFLEYGGDQEFYVASACERVYLLPTSTLDLRGVATYEVFLRGTLDKIGVVPDLVHIGDFKTAVNTFTEKTYTPAHREMAESLNNDAFDQLVQGIAQGRKKNVDEVRKLIDEGPFLPEDALRLGFVDDLAYRDEVAGKAGFGDVPETKAEDYQRDVLRASSGFGLRRADKIAVIYAVGTIATGKSGDGPDGIYAGSDTLVDYVKQAREDSTVKAIVLRIDSPGGSTIASDVIWRELMLARARKPLVVSMSDLAASGGYYIAMPAHAIVAEPGTLTGSIGIFGGKFVTGGTFKKLGANVEGVSRGKFADINSPTKPYSKEEREKIEEQLQAFYDQFIEKVAAARQSTPEKIDAIAQGRVWTGRQAVELKLVDQLGGLGTAVRLARQYAKLPADRDVDLEIYPPKKSLYELFFDMNQSSQDSSSASLTTAAFWRMLNPSERRAMADLTAPFRLLRRGEPLALMPYVFVR